MRPRSLRLRLLVGAALWIVLALLIAGVAIGFLFVQNVERSVRSDLTVSLNRLIAQIDPAAMPPALTRPLADPRYDTPLSGLYWQVTDLGGGSTTRSRSLWDAELLPDAALFGDGQSHFVTLAGPAGQSLSALVRQVRFKPAGGTRAYLVAVAEDRSVLDASISQFGHDLVFALTVLGLVLMAAAWLQVRLGLAPLGAVRAGIDAIRRGEKQALPENYPSEVLPLVAGVNDLLRSQEKSMQFARARAADLAHGLKTPLSVFSTIATDLRQKGDVETASLLEMMARDMAERIDYQLRLSRLRLRDRTHAYRTSINKAFARTISVMEKTREGELLDWSFRAEAPIDVDIERHDLLELAGLLLENAAKWARSRVEITLRQTGDSAEAIIADDGPGLTPEQISQIGTRGKRLDESKKGSGLGLAIAHEIVELNGGRIAFDESPMGGLRVTLRLPLAGP